MRKEGSQRSGRLFMDEGIFSLSLIPFDVIKAIDGLINAGTRNVAPLLNRESRGEDDEAPGNRKLFIEK